MKIHETIQEEVNKMKKRRILAVKNDFEAK